MLFRLYVKMNVFVESKLVCFVVSIIAYSSTRRIFGCMGTHATIVFVMDH